MNYRILRIDKIYKRLNLLSKSNNLSAIDQKFLLYKLIVLSNLSPLLGYLINESSFKKITKELNSKLSLNECKLNFNSQKIQIKKDYFFKNILKINLNLINSIYQLIFSLFRKNKKKYSIFFGDLYKNKNINLREINKFFLKNYKLFKIKDEKVVFESNYNLNSNRKYLFKKNALLFVAVNSLNTFEKIKLISVLFKLILITNVRILFKKSLIFIGNDFLNNELAKFLNSKNIINKIFFFHTSAINSLPMWTFSKYFKYQKNYIFDSVSNFYPLKLKNNKNSKIIYLPQLKFINFNNIYSPDEKIFKIKNREWRNIKIIKPIIYNIKRKDYKITSKNNICIFDYAPQKSAFKINRKLYSYFLYGDSSRQYNFIHSILKVVDKINNKQKNKINCYLKGQYTPGRNQAHLNKIFKLKKKYKYFHILDPQTYIEKKFYNFKTVISFPNTSPSIIFNKIMKKPSIYYDFSNLISNSYGKNIYLIKSEKKLEKLIRKLF